jgi:hypothetical protein
VAQPGAPAMAIVASDVYQWSPGEYFVCTLSMAASARSGLAELRSSVSIERRANFNATSLTVDHDGSS